MIGSVDAGVQYLGYDAVTQLRQELERSYSPVRVTRPVELTRVSGTAATITRWKAERSGDEKEVEPAEGHSTETWQGSSNAPRLGGSGNGHGLRR